MKTTSILLLTYQRQTDGRRLDCVTDVCCFFEYFSNVTMSVELVAKCSGVSRLSGSSIATYDLLDL